MAIVALVIAIVALFSLPFFSYGARYCPVMLREQADQRAAEPNRDHPNRGAHRWFARQGEEGWEVARVTIPGGVRLDPLQAAVESKPRPEAPDPRPAFFRDVGGPYAG